MVKKSKVLVVNGSLTTQYFQIGAKTHHLQYNFEVPLLHLQKIKLHDFFPASILKVEKKFKSASKCHRFPNVMLSEKIFAVVTRL